MTEPATPRPLPPGARSVLLAPNGLARAIAAADGDPERRWMLRLPRDVRRRFVAEVIDGDGEATAQERWMLLETDAVRESYLAEVLLAGPEPPDAREAWMLRQPKRVRESYVREVLDAPAVAPS